MNEQAQELRDRIVTLEADWKDAKLELDLLVKLCPHNWREEYTPEHQEAYTIPGDKPGTMGSDFRGPVHVPAKTTDMWTRECTMCGHAETTTRTEEEVKKTKSPKW